MKLRFVFGLALLAAGAVQAQEAVQVYAYGTPLDIARVLDMSEPPSDLCEPVQARMTYLDSAGVQHTLQYLKLATEACAKGG